jgi:hypothetical protein
VQLTYFSDHDAVAVDLLMEAGFALQLVAPADALRLWVLGIRGKINGMTVAPAWGRRRARQLDWVTYRTRDRVGLEMWVRAGQTDDLFSQIQRELDGFPALEQGLGFYDEMDPTADWSGLRDAAYQRGLRLAGDREARVLDEALRSLDRQS